MSAGLLIALVVLFSLVITTISLLSLFILYQLYSHLCCNRRRLKLRAKSRSNTATNSSTNSTQSGNTSSSSSSSTSDMHGFFKVTTLTATTAFLLTVLCVNTERIGSSFPGFERYELPLFLANPFFYFLGRIVLSLIFIGRLYYTFKDSIIDRYTPRCMKALFLTWLSMPISITLSFLVWPISTAVCFALSALFILVDNVLSWVLMIMYMKKLKSLTKVAGSKPAWLVQLMTQYTLLYAVCFVSSLLVLLSSSVLAVPLDGENTRELFRVFWLFVAIDCFCNTLALWLNLSFAKQWYVKFCTPCHRRVEACFGYSSHGDMMVKAASTSDMNDSSGKQTHSMGSSNNNTVEVEMSI